MLFPAVTWQLRLRTSIKQGNHVMTLSQHVSSGYFVHCEVFWCWSIASSFGQVSLMTREMFCLQNDSDGQWLRNSRSCKALLLSAGHLRASVTQHQPRVVFQQRWAAVNCFLILVASECSLLVTEQFSAGFWAVRAVVTDGSAILEIALL